MLALLAGACSSGSGAGEDPASTRSPVLPTWTTVTDAPTPRNSAASTVSDGLLYLMGGVTPTGVTRRVEHYDAAVNAWTAAPDLPIALRDAAAVARGREIVVMGGFTDAAATKPSARVFSMREGAWRELAPLPVARGALGAAVVGQKIYAIGGREAGDEPSRRVDVLEGRRWTSGPGLPSARSHLAVASGDRYIYAIGGRARDVTGVVERFDTARGSWQRRASLNTPRAEHIAAGGAGSIVAVGGATRDGALRSIESYAASSNTWSAYTPALPLPLRAMGGGLVDSILVIATGATAGLDTFTSQAQSLVVRLSAVPV